MNSVKFLLTYGSIFVITHTVASPVNPVFAGKWYYQSQPSSIDSCGKKQASYTYLLKGSDQQVANLYVSHIPRESGCSLSTPYLRIKSPHTMPQDFTYNFTSAT